MRQPEGCKTQFFLTASYENAFHSDILNNTIFPWNHSCRLDSNKKFVKSPIFTHFFPRDSIGKFFPWEEFSNAWRWFDEIFSALIFLPRDSIGKFFPWEEFSNAWRWFDGIFTALENSSHGQNFPMHEVIWRIFHESFRKFVNLSYLVWLYEMVISRKYMHQTKEVKMAGSQRKVVTGRHSFNA